MNRLHFSFQNFLDTMIDYPNTKKYAFEVLDKYGELGILEHADKYKEHIAKLEDGSYE